MNNAIKNSSFAKLQDMESMHGFTESSVREDGKKNKFFFLGPKNDWNELLDKEIVNEINEEFKIEMKELGYL